MGGKSAEGVNNNINYSEKEKDLEILDERNGM